MCEKRREEKETLNEEVQQSSHGHANAITLRHIVIHAITQKGIQNCLLGKNDCASATSNEFV